jgi:hypothetical protein
MFMPKNIITAILAFLGISSVIGFSVVAYMFIGQGRFEGAFLAMNLVGQVAIITAILKKNK